MSILMYAKASGLARLAAVSVMIVAAASHASVTGTTGQFVNVPMPPSLVGGVFASGTTGYAFNERQNVYFNGQVDVANPALSTPYVYNMPGLGQMYTGWVSSHLIHVDNQGSNTGNGNWLGTVTFSDPIVGLIMRASPLDATDAALGNLGTIYPVGNSARGMAVLGGGLDTVTLLSPYTIQITFGNGGAMDQLRVLTIPTPGASIGLVLAVSLGARRRRA